MCRKWAATRFQQNDNVTVTPPGEHRVLHGWCCCISVILFGLISDILPLKVCFSSCTFPEFVIRCIRSEIDKNQEETEWHSRSLCGNSEFSLCINITVHFSSSNTLRQTWFTPEHKLNSVVYHVRSARTIRETTLHRRMAQQESRLIMTRRSCPPSLEGERTLFNDANVQIFHRLFEKGAHLCPLWLTPGDNDPRLFFPHLGSRDHYHLQEGSLF